MKVDGGKCLTSSGFTNWFGAKLMDRRFEATSTSKISYYMKKAKDGVIRKSKFPHGSAGWVRDMQTSNWATQVEEAHEKVQQDYVTMIDNKDRISYYVKGHNEGGVFQPKKARRDMGQVRPSNIF